jgi:hypothetical protein
LSSLSNVELSLQPDINNANPEIRIKYDKTFTYLVNHLLSQLAAKLVKIGQITKFFTNLL